MEDENVKVEVEIVEAAELKEAVVVEQPKQSKIKKAWSWVKKNWKPIIVGSTIAGVAGGIGYMTGKNSSDDEDYSRYSDNDSDDDDENDDNDSEDSEVTGY